MRRPALIRKILVYVVYTLLVCCFQVSFPEIMSYRGQVADLMLVFTVVVSYFFGFLDGAVVGIFVGILRDYFAAPTRSGYRIGASCNVPGKCIRFIFLYKEDEKKYALCLCCGYCCDPYL